MIALVRRGIGFGGGGSGQRLRFGLAWLMRPFEFRAARPEAREVTPARNAAQRLRSDIQFERYSSGWPVVLRTPCREFLPVTARAVRIFPCRVRPRAGLPARQAQTAAKLIDPQEPLHELAERTPRGDASVSGAALGAVQLHTVKRVPSVSDSSDRRRCNFVAPERGLHKFCARPSTLSLRFPSPAIAPGSWT